MKGLRREEVALLAGVSVNYYTKLERGNLAGASESVLDALAHGGGRDPAHHLPGRTAVRATLMYGAGDVRVEDVPDPTLQQPTDALVRIVRSCICGSDLHPYHSMPASDQGTPMGHEFLGVVEETGSDVTTVRRGDFSSPRSPTPTAPASSAGRACTPPAATAGSGPPATSAAHKPRRSASRSPTAPS